MDLRAVLKAHIEWATANMPIVVEAVRGEAPVGQTRQLEMFGDPDAKSTLRGAMHGRVTGRTDSVTIEIRNRQSYALIIRNGRGMVVPKKKRVLHWVDTNGNDVFAMKSGPVPPNPYHQRGWDKVRSQVRADLARRSAEAGLLQLRQTIRQGGMI